MLSKEYILCTLLSNFDNPLNMSNGILRDYAMGILAGWTTLTEANAVEIFQTNNGFYNTAILKLAEQGEDHFNNSPLEKILYLMAQEPAKQEYKDIAQDIFTCASQEQKDFALLAMTSASTTGNNNHMYQNHLNNNNDDNMDIDNNSASSAFKREHDDSSGNNNGEYKRFKGGK